jgi:cytochrome c peroxidase
LLIAFGPRNNAGKTSDTGTYALATTDLGQALVDGNFDHVGKIKGPILRGLAARAPYFHNGSAATLRDAVNFYDTRFSLHLSEQDKEDLVSFLKTL